MLWSSQVLASFDLGTRTRPLLWLINLQSRLACVSCRTAPEAFWSKRKVNLGKGRRGLIAAICRHQSSRYLKQPALACTIRHRRWGIVYILIFDGTHSRVLGAVPDRRRYRERTGRGQETSRRPMFWRYLPTSNSLPSPRERTRRTRRLAHRAGGIPHPGQCLPKHAR